MAKGASGKGGAFEEAGQRGFSLTRAFKCGEDAMTGMTRDMAGGTACALGTLAAGSTGALFMGSLEEWYPTLVKPPFNPPNWLFGPVWTALYLAMGLALWLVVRAWMEGARAVKSGPPRSGLEARAVKCEPQGSGLEARARAAVVLFGIQFALNVAWSPVFFGLRSPAVALVIICLMLPAAAATAALSWHVSRWAGGLLAPYVAWIAFATLLNASIVVLN
jgi:benzodiazapine receptor